MLVVPSVHQPSLSNLPLALALSLANGICIESFLRQWRAHQKLPEPCANGFHTSLHWYKLMTSILPPNSNTYDTFQRDSISLAPVRQLLQGTGVMKVHPPLHNIFPYTFTNYSSHKVDIRMLHLDAHQINQIETQYQAKSQFLELYSEDTKSQDAVLSPLQEQSWYSI